MSKEELKKEVSKLIGYDYDKDSYIIRLKNSFITIKFDVQQLLDNGKEMKYVDTILVRNNGESWIYTDAKEASDKILELINN